jgi:hypothetical protein
MSRFHIAQMNVGHALHPLDDARMKEFIAGPVTDMKPEPYCVGWA